MVYSTKKEENILCFQVILSHISISAYYAFWSLVNIKEMGEHIDNKHVDTVEAMALLTPYSIIYFTDMFEFKNKNMFWLANIFCCIGWIIICYTGPCIHECTNNYILFSGLLCTAASFFSKHMYTTECIETQKTFKLCKKGGYIFGTLLIFILRSSHFDWEDITKVNFCFPLLLLLGNLYLINYRKFEQNIILKL